MADNNEIEETFTDPVAKFTTIGNLENSKRGFFNNDFELFTNELKEKPYKFYNVSYKYFDDFTGRPSFIARNLNRGFVKDLEDFRKYFFVVFRCKEISEKTYEYSSKWIVNTTDDIKNIIGERYDDFEWKEVNSADITEFNNFINDFMKLEKDDEDVPGLVSEDYVH